MPKKGHFTLSKPDNIPSVVVPVEGKTDPKAPVDDNAVSFDTSQSKKPTLNNQSDKKNKFMKENTENATGTTCELRKPNECNVDNKEDDVQSWDDLKVIDSIEADDESLSKHNDLSEGEIESDNDVSTSEIIRNNSSANRDEKLSLKSDDLSTEKMKKSKNNVMKQAHSLNYNIDERNYQQDTDATWSRCKSSSRSQEKRKYTKARDDSCSSEKRKCRSMGTEESHKLDQMSNRKSRILECSNTFNSQINNQEEAACHGVKEQSKVSKSPGQQNREVQCVPAFRSRDDALKKRHERKHSGPSTKLSSREFLSHSQRKKQESRTNESAYKFVETVKHNSYNSKHGNDCKEQRHSGNAVTREGVSEQISLNGYREFGSQSNRNKGQLQIQFDIDSRNTTQRFKDSNIKSSATTNSHNMARNNRSINAEVTYKPFELRSDNNDDGHMLISADEKCSDYQETCLDRMDAVPSYNCMGESRNSSRHNCDRFVSLNRMSPEREPHNRSSDYKEISTYRQNGTLPNYSYKGESSYSSGYNCDRSVWLNKTSTQRKLHKTRSDCRVSSTQPLNCTMPNSYNTRKSLDRDEIHDSNKHVFDGKNFEKNPNIYICEKFTTNPKNKHECSDLHVCKYFLLSNCQLRGCQFGHNLRDQHNGEVLKCHDLETCDDETIKEIMRHFDNRNVSTIPLVCKFYNNEGGCGKGGNCNHLHICKYYINENCKFNDTCKRSHNFADDHPLQILTNYGIYTLNEDVIRSLLLKTLQNGEVKLKRNISEGISQQGL